MRVHVNWRVLWSCYTKKFSYSKETGYGITKYTSIFECTFVYVYIFVNVHVCICRVFHP